MYRWTLLSLLMLVCVCGCYDHKEMPARTPPEAILNCRGQSITAVPPVAPTIQALYLRDNVKLTDFTAMRGASVDMLDISECALKTFPEEVLTLTKLTQLYASDNQLENVPALANLNTLTYINLDRAGVKTLGALPAGLRFLRVNDNALTQLPELPKTIVNLYARGNKLTEFPNLAGAPGLKYLQLSGNPITQCPDWVAQLGTLETLILNNTQISSLPADLSGLKSLKVLQLVGCKLSKEEQVRIRAAFPDLKTFILF